jgi:hypothetical protein
VKWARRQGPAFITELRGKSAAFRLARAARHGLPKLPCVRWAVEYVCPAQHRGTPPLRYERRAQLGKVPVPEGQRLEVGGQLKSFIPVT